VKTQTLTVDLHIEKIARAYRSFTPADSLIYQLEVFDRTLKANRLKKGGKIDFVHDCGTERLRLELIKILNLKFPEFTYEDAPFNIYCFQGAIRVTVR